jgi:hypothetical protein
VPAQRPPPSSTPRTGTARSPALPVRKGLQDAPTPPSPSPPCSCPLVGIASADSEAQQSTSSTRAAATSTTSHSAVCDECWDDGWDLYDGCGIFHRRRRNWKANASSIRPTTPPSSAGAAPRHQTTTLGIPGSVTVNHLYGHWVPHQADERIASEPVDSFGVDAWLTSTIPAWLPLCPAIRLPEEEHFGMGSI